MSDPPTLITGASGFIGRRLRRPGDRALVRRAAAAGEIIGDLDDGESLLRACEGVGQVFHCAGYAHAVAASDPAMHWRINYEGTRSLLKTAGAAGVRRFVFLSSAKAMAEPGDGCAAEDWPGEPLTPYGRAKRAAEDAVLEAGAKFRMHVVNLRLAMVYGHGGRGNLERMARAIRSGWFPPLPETGNKRSLVHVQDVVEVIRLVAEKPEANGQTYIVADPQSYSGREIYDAIQSLLAQGTDSPASIFPGRIPAGLLRTGGAVGNLLGTLLHRQMPLNSAVVDRLLGSAWYCPARIERELGWRAKIGLYEGLREMLGSEASV